MTYTPPLSRPDMRIDLTRWNRAGLARFDYVDGDAAVWLEELRIAMLGLYMRGASGEMRVPEYWRDVFLKPISDWPLPAALKDAKAHLLWKRLFLDAPDVPETGGKRNQRLLDQYDLPVDEYGWEIARAFARAVHVLLGHLDAFANEGYLRTATQWDNVRRLAAMVNYQPRPAASAVSTVALILDPAKGPATIDRGLALKYAPPKVTPLIYETLEPLVAHPELNAARTQDWNKNLQDIDFTKPSLWLASSGEGLSPGAPCALVMGDPLTTAAASIKAADWDKDAGIATLTLEPSPGTGWIAYDTVLMAGASDILTGLPVSDGANLLVIECAEAASFAPFSIVRIVPQGDGEFVAAVIGSKSVYLKVFAAQRPNMAVNVERLTPFTPVGGKILAPLEVTRLYFRLANTYVVLELDVYTQHTEEGKGVWHEFIVPGGTVGDGYAVVTGDRVSPGVATNAIPEIVPGNALQDGRAKFPGKPPKTLAAGDWFVARPKGSTALTALRVEGLHKEEKFFLVQFHAAIGSLGEDTDFHGRLTQTLRPKGFDRSLLFAFSGADAVLEGLSDESRAMLKPGRAVIVMRETPAGPEAAQTSLVSFEQVIDTSGNPTGLTKITLDTDADLSGWRRGETEFHINAVAISHGETKPPKTLGSGDGAQARQSFLFKVENISFTPNSASEIGVSPDMDVAVAGEKWAYRDYIDNDAEGSASYSTTLSDDGTTTIHFRRRLPKGTDNVLVARYRVGAGAEGNACPPYTFEKPMKKHANVTGVIQPFALSGGAAREPVSAMRVNAPARLSANGRAVSLEDFARLCRRNAGVWRARSAAVIAPGSMNVVRITIVPAGGGAISPKLKAALLDFLAAKMLPGTVVDIIPYQPLTIRFDATIRVDVSRYEKNDVRRRAAAGLAAAFALQWRDLGQPIFAAQALAELQRIEGVDTAVLTGFSIANGAVPERVANTGGAVAAYFPTPDQVAYVASAEDIKLTMESA